MDTRPGHSDRPSKDQETSFIEQKDGNNSALQKTVEKLLLIIAFLTIAFLISVSLLMFGTTADTLLLLLSGNIVNIISVLLIFIFRQQLFGSLDKYPLQKDVLERLEAISKKRDVDDVQLTNIVKQLKRLEKEIVSIKKMVEAMDVSSD
jgi:hypothetical protein